MSTSVKHHKPTVKPHYIAIKQQNVILTSRA